MVSLNFYNLKTTNIYIFFSLNQNQNFIKKNTVHNFQTLAQLKKRKNEHVNAYLFANLDKIKVIIGFKNDNYEIVLYCCFKKFFVILLLNRLTQNIPRRAKFIICYDHSFL